MQERVPKPPSVKRRKTPQRTKAASPAKAGPRRKKAVNLSIDATLAADARAAGINLSAFLEDRLRAELKSSREARWKEEHRAAIEESNRYFEEHGNPLEKYRIW